LKTNKYLCIKKFQINRIDFQEDKDLFVNYRDKKKCESYYKFYLVDGGKINNTTEYKCSLFGFVPSIKQNKQKTEKNQFLRIFHIASKKYVKLLSLGKNINKDKENEGYLNTLLELVDFEDETEIFKIMPVNITRAWDYKLLNNLYFLFKSLTVHIVKKSKQNCKIDLKLMFIDTDNELNFNEKKIPQPRLKSCKI